MQLTPEQRAAMDRQLREDPDRRRFHMEYTPRQQADWERAVAEEEAARPANLARVKRMDDAAAEESLSGQLRRAIREAPRPHQELAEAVGITPLQLLDFRAGDASQPSDALDRLIDELGLAARLEAATVTAEESA